MMLRICLPDFPSTMPMCEFGISQFKHCILTSAWGEACWQITAIKMRKVACAKVLFAPSTSITTSFEPAGIPSTNWSLTIDFNSSKSWFRIAYSPAITSKKFKGIQKDCECYIFPDAMIRQHYILEALWRYERDILWHQRYRWDFKDSNNSQFSNWSNECFYWFYGDGVAYELSDDGWTNIGLKVCR